MAYSPYDVTMSATVVKQITQLTHNQNSTPINAFSSTQQAPSAIFQGDTPQSTSFTSTDLGTILALNTSTFISAGLYNASATTSVPFRKRAAGALYTAGAAHIALQCGNTLYTPDSISCPQNESASLAGTLRYVAATDAFTPPVSLASSQTLAAATFVNEYVLHSATIAGAAVPELQSVTITPGITVVEQKAGGGPFPTALYMNEQIPSIEFVTEDLATTAALLEGSALGAGVIVYLAERTASGIITAKATTNHITITAASGMRQVTTMGGDARTNNSGTIRVSGLALTAVVGVAIP